MEHSIVDALANDIKSILLAERALLARGNAVDVLALGDKKSAAIQKFEKALHSARSSKMTAQLRDHIKDIARVAKENEIHFLAVRNGLKGLIARLECVDGESRAGVYSQCGEEVRFNGSVGRYLKKV